MPGSRVLLTVVAPILAMLFSLATIAMLGTSRAQIRPRLGDLTPVEGRVDDQTSGLIAMIQERQVRLGTAGSERVVRAGGCAAAAAALQRGDLVVVWVDRNARIWRIAKANVPLCTYVQANAALDAQRQNARGGAIALAVAGVGCAGLTVFGRRRSG